jgi:Flp pilus assembly protein CpaB
MAQTTMDRARGNGARPVTDEPRLESPSRRRGRLPELAVGVGLMVAFALAAVLWHLSSTDKDPVLALAVDVERGEVVEATDLRVVYMASDEPLASLPGSASATVVGRVATTDLEAGTVLTRSQVTERVVLAPGEGVVGLALDPGQFPALGLAPGDRVNVVTAAPADPSENSAASVVLVSGGEVFAVEDLGNQGRQFVSLRMTEADANRVASAAERGPVRLVLVGS